MEKNKPAELDIQWMLALQNGDESALQALIQAYQHRLLSLAYRFLQNRADAEEAVQEVFIKVYRARHRYQPGAKFSSWLYTIANRVCLNRLRYQKRHPVRHLEEMTAEQEEAGSENWEQRIPDPKARNGQSAVEALELEERVRNAVAELQPEERMALILDHWEGLPHKEIGEVLGKTVPAIKSILFRARARLKIKLMDYLSKE
jgi:RNA polymerase sigma-70 factor (ECF subfamily)